MADQAARRLAIHQASDLVRYGPPWVRRGGHRPDPPLCGICWGDGDMCHPGNLDPERRMKDWLPPVLCSRCGGTGKDPNP